MSIARGTALALLPLLVASTVPGYAQESSSEIGGCPLGRLFGERLGDRTRLGDEVPRAAFDR